MHPTSPVQVRDFPPERILMAPGPSNLHPRVIQALTAPLTGHKDPYFLGVMEETAELLRQVFRTRNTATLALPATGGSGMEASLVNLLEPGDTAVIANAGFFAERMAGIARRAGANTIVVETAWGQATSADELLDVVRRNNARVLALVHGETSTGVEHPLAGIGAGCRELGAYLVVDAVASLGGVPLAVDDLAIDVCYSGAQKCLSAPPGTSPITISDRALQSVKSRRTPVASWYFDLDQHARYWSSEHIYHHTAPVLNIYALREALRIVLEEGLSQGWARHRLHSQALQAGLKAMGLTLFADEPYRLPTVVTVLTPEGINEAAVRNELLDTYSIEIAGGLGAYAGRMWRIGVMGQSAKKANIMLALTAIEQALRRQGWQGASGLAAAEAAYGGA